MAVRAFSVSLFALNHIAEKLESRSVFINLVKMSSWRRNGTSGASTDRIPGKTQLAQQHVPGAVGRRREPAARRSVSEGENWGCSEGEGAQGRPQVSPWGPNGVLEGARDVVELLEAGGLRGSEGDAEVLGQQFFEIPCLVSCSRLGGIVLSFFNLF